MVSKATSTQLKVVKAAAEAKKPSLTVQLEGARRNNKALMEQNKALQELIATGRAVISKPPTLLEYLATVDLSIFDEATASLIQRLQKRLAVV